MSRPTSPMRVVMNAFFAASVARALLPVEADEQERADADQLPRDVEEEQVVGHHEHEHRGGEELEDREEPAVARLALHVADGEDVHHQRDGGDDAEHDDRDRVDVDAHAQLEVADVATTSMLR